MNSCFAKPFGWTIAAMVIGVAIAAPWSSALAQAKTKGPQPTPVMPRDPSGADAVNNMLSPGPYDARVPLPRPGLSNTVGSEPAKSSQIYGRTEDGGGVFGFRVPIPADRNGSSSTTRSGGSSATPEISQ